MVSVPRFIFSLSFASLLLFSCGKAEQTISEVNIVEHGTGLARVFNASSPESKVLIDNSHNLLWEDTDRIWLDGNEFTLLSRDGSRATFGGEVSVEREHYVSFFPYSSSFEGDDYELHAELPSVQYAKENGCPWPLSYAVSDEDKLHFRHLDATLQFTLADDMTGLSRVYFHGNNSEAVCGKVELYFSADYSSISSKRIENDGGEIILEGPFEAGKTYLFNLLPANFSSGITLEFAFDDGTSGCLGKNTSLELSAGTWVNLSNSISKSSLSECTGGIADISQWRAFKAANENGGGIFIHFAGPAA